MYFFNLKYPILFSVCNTLCDNVFDQSPKISSAEEKIMLRINGSRRYLYKIQNDLFYVILKFGTMVLNVRKLQKNIIFWDLDF